MGTPSDGKSSWAPRSQPSLAPRRPTVHHYGRAVIMFGVPYVYTQSRILKVSLAGGGRTDVKASPAASARKGPGPHLCTHRHGWNTFGTSWKSHQSDASHETGTEIVTY